MRNLCLIIVLCVFACNVSARSKKEEGPVYASRAALVESGEICEGIPRGLFLKIASAVLPKLVDQGIGFLEAFLKRIAAEHAAAYGALAADLFYLQCQDASGAPVLKLRFNAIEFGYGPVSGNSTSPDPRFTRLGFTGPAKVYVKLSFVHAGDVSNRVMRLVPEELVFNQPVAKRGSNKDLVLAATFNFPTAVNDKNKPVGATASLVLPPLENLRPGISISLKNLTSDWMVMPAINAAELNLPDSALLPFSIQITVNETDQGLGPELWLRAATAIAESKAKIAAAILGK